MLYLTPGSPSLTDPAIAEAARILIHGGIVAFPTETVYGLGARFDRATAIEKIFAAKGRPSDNPLIVHIAHPGELPIVAAQVPPVAEKLMMAFWPGPLTIVLPKTPAVPQIATGGLMTVGVRMPAHRVALSLIKAVGAPLVAPSANLSGRPSPTSAAHVQEDLTGRIDAILDGGETEVGLESTVVSVVDDRVTVLRPGAVTRAMIEEITRSKVVAASFDPSVAPASPGMKYTHYAPRAQVNLFIGQAVGELRDYARALKAQGNTVAIVAFSDTLALVGQGMAKMSLGERGRTEVAAKRLYAYLREADHLNVDYVLVEGIEPEGLGEALMNRLAKAATQVIGG